MDDKPSEYQMSLLIRYLKAVKWLCEGENIDIVIKNDVRMSFGLKEEKICKNWEELNEEVSKQALESSIFDSYLNVMLNKYDEERKEKIKKIREST